MRAIRYRVQMARPLVLTGRLLLKLRPDTVPKLQAVLGDGEHASTVIRGLIEGEIARREGKAPCAKMPAQAGDKLGQWSVSPSPEGRHNVTSEPVSPSK